MNTPLLFAIEIALCLGISLILIYLLKPFLRDVLTDSCGTVSRADFWVMFTQLMLIIAPLMVVAYFASTVPINQLNIVHELQKTLFRTLLGDFIALSIIGRVVWKSISTEFFQPIHQIENGTK